MKLLYHIQNKHTIKFIIFFFKIFKIFYNKIRKVSVPVARRTITHP